MADTPIHLKKASGKTNPTEGIGHALTDEYLRVELEDGCGSKED